MTDTQWSDEQLLIYADGALSAAGQAELAQDMAQDPALAHRVARMHDTREWSRQVFAAQLEDPVPPALRALVLSMVERDRAQRAQEANAAHAAPAHAPPPVKASTPWWRALAERLAGYAIPAGALASVVVGVFGYWLGSAQPEPGAIDPPLALVPLGAPVAPTLAELLGQLPSGQQAGQQPTVSMMASYRSTTGVLCRDFALLWSDAPQIEAVACRVGDGQWHLRFAAQEVEASDGYATASSHSLLESYLNSMGAGQPLAPQAEREALEGR